MKSTGFFHTQQHILTLNAGVCPCSVVVDYELKYVMSGKSR